MGDLNASTYPLEVIYIYPSDFKMQDSERYHSVNFKESNAADELLPSYLTMKSELWRAPEGRVALPVKQAILAEPSILRLLIGILGKIIELKV